MANAPRTKVCLKEPKRSFQDDIHTNGAGDELWDSLTSSRQIVASGIYILYVEVSEDTFDRETAEKLFSKGESVYRKFVIIR